MRKFLPILLVVLACWLVPRGLLTWADEPSTEKGTAEKGTAEKGTAEKGTAEKGTAEKGTAEKGTAEKGTAEKEVADSAAEKPATLPNIPPEKPITIRQDDLKPLHREYKVWVDPKQKHIVMEGEVCLTRGVLEVFACLKNSKEHEAIVAVKTEAKIVHAALLAIGAKRGSPAKFRPEYQPATGQEIDIYVLWDDAQGKPQQTKAQNWIRNLKTKKEMTYPWVFAGSGFWKDDDGVEHYQAEAGDFICVSNFPGAMLDLPIKSSDENNDLDFEAITERIPEKGTKVKIVLVPKAPAEEKNAPAKGDGKKDDQGPKGQK